MAPSTARADRSRILTYALCLVTAGLMVGSGIAGCATDGEPIQQPSPSSGQMGTAPPTSAPASPPAEPVLADGQHVAYLTGLSVAGKTVTFDLVEFLTGAAANQACVDHNGPECPPPNDYFIVNDNPKLRTLPVAQNVQAKVLKNLGGGELVSITFADLPAHFASTQTGNQLSPLPFKLTVTNGAIGYLEEMFLP